MVLEAGSQRKVFISSFLELIIQVTVLWRRKTKGESISKMEVYRKKRSIKRGGKVEEEGEESRKRRKVRRDKKWKRKMSIT